MSADRCLPELAVGVTGGRIADLSPQARAVHKAILLGFAATGQAPDSADLPAAAAWLAELHDHDVVRVDEHGRIRAAYPFSAVPTAHTVVIDGGPAVYAMCAIDALGIAAMLDRDVTITSTDPAAGEPIRVTIHNGEAGWDPATVVVFVGSDQAVAPAGACCPPGTTCHTLPTAAADRCCQVINFFASAQTARYWTASHPEVSGAVLTNEQALGMGVDIFGRLLHD